MQRVDSTRAHLVPSIDRALAMIKRRKVDRVDSSIFIGSEESSCIQSKSGTS